MVLEATIVILVVNLLETAQLENVYMAMTDAHISAKNITESKIIDKENNETYDNKSIADRANQDDICNNYTSTDTNSQNNQVENKLTVKVAINVIADKRSNEAQDCAESEIVSPSNSSDHSDLLIKNNATDKVLKYVYNNDKNDALQKLKGHPKNSLKRKKRSTNTQNSSEDVNGHESKRAPLIVNYETSHRPLDISPLGSTENNIKKSNLVNSHGTSQIEIELPVHERATGKIIKNSNLADFNIETLHDGIAQPLKNNENLKSDVEVIDIRKNKESEEINDNYAHRDHGRSLDDSEENTQRKEHSDATPHSKSYKKTYNQNSESKESDESKENPSSYTHSDRDSSEKKADFSGKYHTKDQPSDQQYKDEKKSYKESEESAEKSTYPRYNANRNQEDFESNEKDNIRQDKSVDSDESPESYESREIPSNNKLLQRDLGTERYQGVGSNESDSKSKESDETESIESSKYSKSQDNNDESKEKFNERDKSYRDKYSNQFKSDTKAFNEKPRYLQESSEGSNENKDSSRENYKSEQKNHTSPLKIQDVDLGDFSYERIEVNDNGKVVPAKDSYEDNTSPSTSSKSGTLKNIENENISSSSEDLNSKSSSESTEDNKGSVKINAGEIKPVVEINGDHNSDDFISREPINANLEIKDTSLETFLGVKDLQENDQNEKIKVQSEQEKGDVKQQVERIPLDYKHDENETKPSQKSTDPLRTEHKSNVNTQVEVSEGTIESIPTEQHKYDENLNFKFDDVTVSLPEIKLPEDILAYTYEEPHYQKQKKEGNNKPKYYPYESFVKNDDDKNKKSDNDDADDYNDDSYSRYYGNYKQRDNYKKKNDDVEEEEEEGADLYEKFVRERFGKRGTFAQRSEKLQSPKPVDDPILYERIQNVLKKTHDIDKQAEKSGDPNAGYMWTLEYGQKLT